MIINNRILVAGLDKAANNELARNLLSDFGGLVQSENEFQKALETDGKYTWLNLFIEQEQFYHQTLIILWDKHFSNEEKAKLVNYANEVLFEHYSKKKLNSNRTRVYFVQIGTKARYQELAEFVFNSIENENIPRFSIENGATFVWNAPSEIMELIKI